MNSTQFHCKPLQFRHAPFSDKSTWGLGCNIRSRPDTQAPGPQALFAKDAKLFWRQGANGPWLRSLWTNVATIIKVCQASIFFSVCTTRNMCLLISLSVISHPAPSALLRFWIKHGVQTYALDDQIHCFLIL